jgi:hypothetical protein
MRTPKSHKTVMEKLALNPPLSIYRLNKETGHSTSTLHAAIKTLTSNRLVKKHNGGLTLSFKGLVNYLASRFEDPKFQTVEIKQVLAKYAEIDDYPPIMLHKSFQEWLGNSFYDYMASTSHIVKSLFQSEIRITYVKAPKPTKRGEKISVRIPTPSLEEEEKEWKHAFTLTLLKLTLTNPQTKLKKPKDQKIEAFIEETYNQEIQKKEEEIQNLKAGLQKLTSPETY